MLAVQGLKKSIGMTANVFSILLLVACGQQPETGNRLPVPAQGFVGNVQQGEGLFKQFCATCHGPAASGTGYGPPLVHRVYRADHHSDLAFYLAASKGVQQHHWHFGNMPPVKGVSPEQVGHIVAYVRHLQGRAGI